MVLLRGQRNLPANPVFRIRPVNSADDIEASSLWPEGDQIPPDAGGHAGLAPPRGDLSFRLRLDLVRLVQYAKAPAMRGKPVLLLGFSDNVGGFASNSALSLRRANQVRLALLAAAGPGAIDSRRLIAKGYGPLAPVACNDSAAGHDKNRRVEVWVRD